MTEYSKFLKHLGINRDLMLSDMQSKIPDCEKPTLVRMCKDFEVCESVNCKGCKGCNVWNYLYDIKALQNWCKEHSKDFMLYTMEIQKKLKAKEIKDTPDKCCGNCISYLTDEDDNGKVTDFHHDRNKDSGFCALRDLFYTVEKDEKPCKDWEYDNDE